MTGFRDEKKRRRRARIFTAAIALFNQKGFTATAMKEISREADLAVGTLYNYFPSKNDLLLGIMEKKLEDIRFANRRNIVSIFRTEKNPKIIIERIVHLVLHNLFIINKQNWYEIFRAILSVRKDLERGISLDMEGIRMTEDIFILLQKRRLIRSRFAPLNIASNLYSIIVFQFMSYVFNPESTEKELYDNISEQLDLLFEGIGSGVEESSNSGLLQEYGGDI